MGTFEGQTWPSAWLFALVDADPVDLHPSWKRCRIRGSADEATPHGDVEQQVKSLVERCGERCAAGAPFFLRLPGFAVERPAEFTLAPLFVQQLEDPFFGERFPESPLVR